MKTDATVADGLTDRQEGICFLASFSRGSVLGGGIVVEGDGFGIGSFLASSVPFYR